MYEELLKTLRDFTPFSIIVSAVVIFVVFLCVFVIFSFAKREKRIEQLRWNKVSNHMMLRDVQTNEWIPLEADEILVGRHGSADIRLPVFPVIMRCSMFPTGSGVSWTCIPNPAHSSTARKSTTKPF